LIARADIMERAWGARRTLPGQTLDTMSAGTRAENENIAFDLLYVSYASPIGLFNVGYQIDQAWGTVFGDSSIPTGKLTYYLPIGSLGIGLQMGKNPDGERSRGAFGQPAFPLNDNRVSADRDNNFYTAFVRYAWKAGDAGLLFKHIREAGYRNYIYQATGAAALYDTGFEQKVYVLVPYVKAKFGPFAVQAEFTYGFGERKWEGRPDLIPALLGGPQEDGDIKSYEGWVDIVGDFGRFYFGLTGAHVSGEDQGTADIEGQLTGGMDWNPCLIMFNQDLHYWAGNINGYGGTANGSPMTNAWFGQVRAGVRPIDKLDIMVSFSYAKADKTLGVGFDEREYGSEIDVTATYKITNNLSYMLGGGYWIVGDYYKGNAVTNNDLEDNLLLINKLTLTF
jgi:hypothetical protein